MKKSIPTKIIAIALTTVMLLSSCGKSSAPRKEDDFYEAVNHEWIKDAKVPKTEFSVGGFNDLVTDIDDILTKDFDKMSKGEIEPETNEMKEFIKFYNLSMDFDKRKEDGAKPLSTILDKIDSIKTLSDIEENSKELMISGIPVPYGFAVLGDMKDAKTNALYATPPSILMPDKSMYGTESEEQVMPVLEDMFKKLLVLSGKTDEEAEKITKNAIAFDKLLVPSAKSAEDSSDMTKMYNPQTREEFVSHSKNINFEQIIKDITGTEVDKVVVMNPEFYDDIDNIVNENNFELIKDWMTVLTINGYSEFLDEDFRSTAGIYMQMMTGQAEQESKEQSAYDLASSIFAEPIGIYYGKTYFGEESKQDVIGMIDNMVEVYEKRLSENDWLSEETKEKAITKLKAMKVHIGYPEKCNEVFSKFVVDENKNLLENALEINRVATESNFEEFGKPVNSDEWNIPAHMVNATYDPMANTITFPAAILQAPFYSKDQTPSQNYGGIGAVIAHEISHAFDPNGSQFDEFGNIENWWTDADYKAFEEKTEKMLKEFDGIDYAGGKVNGQLTLSENVADAGGLRCALEVVKSLPDANLEEFFTNWATIWKSKSNPEYEQMLLTVDPHAPNKIRANVQLQNIDEFFEVFNITEEDEMYKAPEDRVSIW